MVRRFGGFFLALAGLVLAQPAAGAGTAFLLPVEEGYVRAVEPTRSFDAAWELRSGVGAGSADVQRAFLRFALPTRYRIHAATLRGTYRGPASGTSAPGVHVFDFVPDDAWTSSGLTWNSQPSASAERVGSYDAPAYHPMDVAFDVTLLAQREQLAGGMLSLRIAAADESRVGTGLDWANRRSGSDDDFRLELLLDPAPTLEPGDVVALHEGVMALDPDDGLHKPLGPIFFPQSLSALAIDPRDGSLVALDRWREAIVRIDPASGDPQPLAIGGDLFRGYFLALAPDGDVYVSGSIPTDEGDEGVVLRVDAETGARETVAQGGDLQALQGIAVDGSGRIVVADSGAHQVVRIDPATGAKAVMASGGLLDRPFGLAIDASGAVWVVSMHDYLASPAQLVRIDPISGAQSLVATLPSYAGVIAAGAPGTIWVGSLPDICGTPCGFTLWRVDTATGTVTTFFESQNDDLGGLAAAADGSLLATRTDFTYRTRISRFDPGTGGESVFAAPLDAESALATLDAERRLLVVSLFGDRLWHIDPLTGRQQGVAVSVESGSEPLLERLFIDRTVASDGSLYVLEQQATSISTVNHRILTLDPATGSTQLVAQLGVSARALAVESSGDFLVACRTGGPISDFGTIQRVSRESGIATPLASGGLLRNIVDLAVDRSGGIWVADSSQDAILRVDPTNGAVSMAPSITGLQPTRIAVDHAGRILVTGAGMVRLDPSSGELVQLAAAHRLPGVAPVVVEPHCSDGFDNDADGAADWPADASCFSAEDDFEQPHGCGLGFELAPVLAWLAGRRARSRPIRDCDRI